MEDNAKKLAKTPERGNSGDEEEPRTPRKDEQALQVAPGAADLRQRLADNNASTLTPSFLQRLLDPAVKSVLLAGCGGGFDFLHSMLLYPELRRAGKKITILSFSFGVVNNLQRAQVVYEGVGKEEGAKGPECKLVTSKTVGSTKYQPEVGLQAFLRSMYPGEEHGIYACYARAWTMGQLKGLYEFLCARHSVDAICVMDGGSDSLMRGDEAGLGDPAEDAVSVGAAALAQHEGLKLRLLVSAGFGSDRFNDVSDASSLRAMAEITKLGGSLGSVGIEPSSLAFQFYEAAIDHVYDQQSFRSVLTALIRSAARGEHGFLVPAGSEGRVRNADEAFVWPLMATLYAFDCTVVARRSLLHEWLRDCRSAAKHERLIAEKRAAMEERGELRPVEDLPRHADMRCKGLW
jgi:hypothetical protein